MVRLAGILRQQQAMGRRPPFQVSLHYLFVIFGGQLFGAFWIEPNFVQSYRKQMAYCRL